MSQHFSREPFYILLFLSPIFSFPQNFFHFSMNHNENILSQFLIKIYLNDINKNIANPM